MEIIWTKKALVSYKELVVYINNSFGKQVAEETRLMINNRVVTLLTNPLPGKKYPKDISPRFEFRFIVICKQCKVFYFIEGEYIYISLVWDTRQDLSKLHEDLFSTR